MYQTTSLLAPANSETVKVESSAATSSAASEVISDKPGKPYVGKIAKGKEVPKANAVKATAPAKAPAPELKEENPIIGDPSLLSFDELQRRRSRARLTAPPPAPKITRYSH
jgi:hypothetical protein